MPEVGQFSDAVDTEDRLVSHRQRTWPTSWSALPTCKRQICPCPLNTSPPVTQHALHDLAPMRKADKTRTPGSQDRESGTDHYAPDSRRALTIACIVSLKPGARSAG